MEAGETMEQAVAEARRAGVAESDPSHDLEGWDAAAKLAILATVLLDGDLSPLDVERTGIAALDPEEVRGVRRQGRRVKLVCRARRQDGGVRATVAPERLDGDDPLARHGGAGSVLRIETDLMGPILVQQESPTLRDTAYGVLNDLLAVVRGDGGSSPSREPPPPQGRQRP
jgi:homoserine dehydrogenase